MAKGDYNWYNVYMTNKNTWIIAVLLVLALLGFVLMRRSENPSPQTDLATTTSEGTDIDLTSTTTSTSTPGYTIERIDYPTPVPKLYVPQNSNKSISSDAVAQTIAKIKAENSVLATNPALTNDWIILGSYRKLLGDYAGTVEVWDYAVRLSPSDFVTYNNLADLYAYNLHDNAKAEVNYKLAITYGSNQVNLYRALYDFYRNVLGDDVKAKAILRSGIAANPTNSADLKYLLDHYTSAQ